MRALLEAKAAKNYYRGIVNAAVDIFKEAEKSVKKMVGSKGKLDVNTEGKFFVGLTYEGVDTSDHYTDFFVFMFYMPEGRNQVRISWGGNGFKGEIQGERMVDVVLVSPTYIANIVKHEGLFG